MYSYVYIYATHGQNSYSLCGTVSLQQCPRARHCLLALMAQQYVTLTVCTQIYKYTIKTILQHHKRVCTRSVYHRVYKQTFWVGAWRTSGFQYLCLRLPTSIKEKIDKRRLAVKAEPEPAPALSTSEVRFGGTVLVMKSMPFVVEDALGVVSPSKVNEPEPSASSPGSVSSLGSPSPLPLPSCMSEFEELISSPSSNAYLVRLDSLRRLLLMVSMTLV